MLDLLLLFAEAEGDKQPDGNPLGGLGPLPMLLAIMALFYLLLILPAQRRERKHKETVLNAMKKGDKVLTTSGIIGVISFLKDEEVTLKLEEGKMRVLRSTIVKIFGSEEQPKDAVQEAGNKT
jgi:preprotein translocase subunit YajC